MPRSRGTAAIAVTIAYACVCVCVCVCVYVCSRGTAAIAKTIGCKHDVTMCMMMWHTVWWCDTHTHICDTLYDDVTHTHMCVCHVIIHSVTSSYTLSAWPEWQTGYVCVSHHHTPCHIIIHNCLGHGDRVSGLDGRQAMKFLHTPLPDLKLRRGDHG